MVKTPKKLAPRGKPAMLFTTSPKPPKPKRKPLKAKVIQRVVARVTADDSRNALVLDRLFAVIDSRRDADPALSHSARLLARGHAKVAQKFGEESVEAVIECVMGDKPALIAESADVLYHLLLMWVSCGIAPAEVWAELERREGVSGIIEKASRPLPRDVVTRKIP